MPNWKKVIVSGSDAILQDVTINDWGSVSASLASIESTSTSQTLQDVTDNGSTTTNSITIDGSSDASLILDRNAVSNDAEIVFTTNGTENWSIGTGQVGGDNDFTLRSYGSSNAVRFHQDGHINAQGSITGSSFLSEGDILPDQDNVHSLGSSTRRFQLNGGTPVTVTGSGTNGTVTRFSGSTEVENSTITNTDSLTVITHDNDGNDIFIVSGSNGELIKVTDSVDSTLFQVNDGSGISQFEVSSTGVISIGSYTTIESNRLTISDGSSATATRLAHATYCGVIVDYTIYSTDSGRTNQRTGTYRATFNDSEVHDSETMTNDIGDTNGFVFSTSLDGTNFTLTANNDIGQQCRVSYTVKPILV